MSADEEGSEARTLLPPHASGDAADAVVTLGGPAAPVGALALPLESQVASRREAPGVGPATRWTGAAPPPAEGKPDSTRWTGEVAAPGSGPAASALAQGAAARSGDVPATLGEYEVGERLGEGGMGAVYRGTDRSLRRPVAIKVLSTRVLDDTRATERFLREARSAASVSHPNVITVFAVGQEPRPYMVMELVTGGDAAQLAYRSGGRLPERRALEIIRDCCKGLSAIERAGLVHRDIKPANIFIVGDGTAKLADLGLARSATEGEDRMTQTGVVVGTPAYMSPEQAGGEEVDVRTDIWALGASLYELVSGRPPYSGSVMAVVKQVLTAPPPDPRAVSPPLSPLCCDVIRRAMAKEAVDRFPSALSMLEAVEAALAKSKAPRPDGHRVDGPRAGEGARIGGPAPERASRPPSARTLAAPTAPPPPRPAGPAEAGGVGAGKLVGGLALFAGAIGLWALVSARGWGKEPAVATGPDPAPPVATATEAPPDPATDAGAVAPVATRVVDDTGLEDFEGPGLLVDDVVLDDGAPFELRAVGKGETARQTELVGAALPAPLRVSFTLSELELTRNRRAPDAAEREAGVTEGAPGWTAHAGVRADAAPVGDPLAQRGGAAVWVALYFERGGPIRGVVHERQGGKSAALETFRIDRFAADRDEVRVLWTVAKNGWRASVLVAGREGWARGRAWSVAAPRETWTPWAVVGPHRDGDGQGSLKATTTKLEANVAADLSVWRRPVEPAGPSGPDPTPGTRRPRATPVTPQPQPQPQPMPPPPPPPPRGGPPPRR